MTARWGDTGLVSVGTAKSFTVTLATPQEYTVAAVTLPTTAPTSPQVTVTVTAADFPVFNGGIAYNNADVAATFGYMVMVGGANASGATATISATVFKNGTQVLTGSLGTVLNGQKWTVWCGAATIAPTDVITVKVWCDQASGVNYTYYGLYICPSRMRVTKAKIMIDTTYTHSSVQLAGGTSPLIGGNGFFQYYASDISNLPVSGNFATYHPNDGVYAQHPTYGMGRLDRGDLQNDMRLYTHATSCPAYLSMNYPSKITFREIFL